MSKRGKSVEQRRQRDARSAARVRTTEGDDERYADRLIRQLLAFKHAPGRGTGQRTQPAARAS